MRKQKLEEALEQVQQAIEMLRDTEADIGVSFSDVDAVEALPDSRARMGGRGNGDDEVTSSVASDSDYETTQVSSMRCCPLDLFCVRLRFLWN